MHLVRRHRRLHVVGLITVYAVVHGRDARDLHDTIALPLFTHRLAQTFEDIF